MKRMMRIPLVALAATACNTDRAAVEDSLDRWNAVTDANGEHYTYETHALENSVAAVTTFEVKDHEVIRRWYWNEPGAHGDFAKTVWLESGDDVGSHAAGAPPLTIDDLYAECLDAIDATGMNRVVGFDTDAMGLMTRCYVDEACNDAEAGCNEAVVDLNVHALQFWP